MKIFSALLICLIHFSSCGKSPLFNHQNADDFDQNEKKSLLEKKTPLVEEACDFHFEKLKKCASLIWEFQPNLKKKTDGSFFLHTWDGENKNTTGTYSDLNYDLRLYLFMGSMGHGTGKDILISPLKMGELHATAVYPIMRGDWQIYFELIEKNTEVVIESTKLCCEFNGIEMKCPIVCPE